jgi:hypothetical protein
LTQNEDQEKETRPARHKRLSGFLIGLLSSAIPFVVLFIAITAMVGRGGNLVWMLSLGLCVFALLVSAAFAIADKRRIALGILAGVAVGIVGLVLSCSIVLSSPATTN